VQHQTLGTAPPAVARTPDDDATTARDPASVAITVVASQRGYRRFAPLYDWVFGLSLEHGRRVALRALDARAGDRVLEVGVGSGQSLRRYATGVELTGVDVSPEMLAKAEARLRALPLARTAQLLEMDAGALAFDHGGFDKAVLLFVVAGLPDPVTCLREVRRVCRPGATIVIASHFRSGQPLLRLFDRLLAPIYRALRYRDDLDCDEFVTACGLEVVDALPVNLFGYSTVLVCRSP